MTQQPQMDRGHTGASRSAGANVHDGHLCDKAAAAIVRRCVVCATAPPCLPWVCRVCLLRSTLAPATGPRLVLCSIAVLAAPYLSFPSTFARSPFFFYLSGAHRDLHSFPTRRSSD